MKLKIHNEKDINSTHYVRDKLIEYNLKHIPSDLQGSYGSITLFLKDDEGSIYGGLLGEVCWNWIEIHIFWVDETLRGKGYGKKMMNEVEEIAKQKQLDFIKLDTLSFQALEFYQKLGYELYGEIDHAAREHTHYYLKKDM